VTVIQGVTLTVEPGVTVRFKPNTALQVDGTLVARGTKEKPITFTAAEGQNPGSWGSILFTDKSTPTELDGDGNYVKGCLLEYALIEYAGGMSDIGAAVRVNASNLLVDYCTISNSARIGVWVNKKGVIRNSTISKNKSSGIYPLVGSTVTITNNTITGNTGSGIYYFAVTAYYANEVESGFSNEVRSNSPPRKPSNAEPVDGAKDIPLTPTLKSSPFTDPESFDTHKASQWQISTISGNYANPVYDSGTDTKNLTSLTLQAGKLSAGNTYYWRVRHQDSRSAWSEYSTEKKFTTVSETSAVGTFTLSLAKGLNFVSLPVKPDVSYTARTFAEKLAATLVVRYDAPSQRFIPFVPEVSRTDGFGIEGGQGYIVNVLEERRVPFTGTVWTNAPPASSERIVEEGNTVWAFAVAGGISAETHLKWPVKELQITVQNKRTGQISQSKPLNDTGDFAVAFVDMNRQSVVQAGDMLEITVRNSRGELVSAPVENQIREIDLARATLVVNHSVGEVIPSQSKLFQNYPNPFNPETWMPFQLAQPAEVNVRIY